ncbi:MAG: tRNA guanosine(34) transglycosylase Tgt [Chitinophagales bacterium]|nr:tRNA guanosine(34) transglycosylase Tgt [Chitinophagales bacterium]
MNFELQHKDQHSSARAAKITTDHGVIETPIFMPVGTAGTVKAVHFSELLDPVKAQIILGNTYHLYLRPGTDIIQKAEGLHRFIDWKKPLLTDSGGYQVYSLAENRKLDENGVHFKSHIDGSMHYFTPESNIDVQRKIGADIIMVLDECTPYPCEYDYAKNSMELTHRWSRCCCDHFDQTASLYDYDQTLFPIVQGSVYKDLRKASAEYTASLDRDGNAIGGLSVGEPEEDLYEMTAHVCEFLPKQKPRYLMGVGTPANLLNCIALGIDMFDCVMPTRNARNGMLFTTQGIINIRNEKWKEDFSPIDEFSPALTSRQHSKAYLRHLIMSKEILGAQICSINNLSLYLWLVNTARNKIIDNSFNSWKNTMVETLAKRL